MTWFQAATMFARTTSILALTALLSSLTFSAVAQNRVGQQIMNCRGERAVGYTAYQREPYVFSGSPRYRIDESTDRGGRKIWTVIEVGNDNTWIGAGDAMGADDYDLPNFQLSGDVWGRLFVMSKQSGDFVYTENLGFIQGNPVITPYMVIGKCERIKKPADS